MIDVNIITVAQFTAYAPEVDVTQYDAPTLSGMIGDASKMVSDILGYTPVAEVIVDELRPGRVATNGDLVIYTEKVPILSLTSVSLMKGATTVALNLVNGAGVNKYNIDYTKRKIVLPLYEVAITGSLIFSDFYALRGRDFLTKVTYQAGWALADIPGPIRQATILLVRDMIAKKFNQAGASTFSQGGISMGFSQSDKQGESQLVKEAKRLLTPYRRIG
jgi:hypothetical protein